MEHQSIPTPHADQLAHFDSQYNRAMTMADQNQRHETALDDPTFDGNEEFRDLTVQWLQTEQDQTMQVLRAADLQAYDDITTDYQSTERQLQAAQHDLETMTDEDDTRRTALMNVARRAIELAPLAEASAMSLAEQMLADAKNLNRSGLEAHIESLQHDMAQLSELEQSAGRAWPLPLIGRAAAEELAGEPTNDDDLIESTVEDEMPAIYKPDSREHGALVRRMTERHGVLRGASMLTAIHLIEHEGRSLTPVEIGREVYQGVEELDELCDEERDKNVGMRVVALLYAGATRAAELLEGEGYRLQAGWRRAVDADGRQVGGKRRIYRAIPLTAANSNQPLPEYDQRVTPTTGEQPITHADEAVVAAPTAEQLDKIEAELALKTRDQLYSELERVWADDAAKLLPWLQEHKIIPASPDEKVVVRNVTSRLTMLKAQKKLDHAPGLPNTDKMLNHFNEPGYTSDTPSIITEHLMVYGSANVNLKELKSNKVYASLLRTTVTTATREYYELNDVK